MAWRILQRLLTITAVVLFGALISASLVRFSPGFETDEQQLDPRLNSESLQSLRKARADEHNVAKFYVRYLTGIAEGNLGDSHSLGQPVRTLLRDRLPATLRLITIGLALAWALALALALSAALLRSTGYTILAIALAGAFLCVPAAVLALASVILRAPGYLAIAFIVFPKLFTYTRNLLEKAYSAPHIVTARCKGLTEHRILFWHVLPGCAPAFLALAGVSVSIAIGAAIPVEALCGIAGVGELAWEAALSRDLPLLVTLTALVTTVTLFMNTGADVIVERVHLRQP